MSILGILGAAAASEGLGIATGAAKTAINNKINKKYNIEAENRAWEKQMALYDKQYRDNSPMKRVEEMKKAGLSVGLMYGGTGAGVGGGAQAQQAHGSTADGTGAQGGDIAGNALALMTGKQQLENLKAQEELTKAEKLKVETEANKMGSVDTDKVKAEIENLKKQTDLKGEEIELNKLMQNSLDLKNKFDLTNNRTLLKSNMEIMSKLVAERKVSEATVNSLIELAKENVRNVISNTALNNAKIKLTEAEINEIVNNISVQNEKLVIDREGLKNALEIARLSNASGTITKDLKGLHKLILNAFGEEQEEVYRE